MKIRFPIRRKLLILAVLVSAPFLVIALYLLFSIRSYSSTYDQIVSNMMWYKKS